MGIYRSENIFGSTEMEFSDGPTWKTITRQPGVAPLDRTVFYLNDEEAKVITRMRKAVQAQRKLNRKRSTSNE